MSVCGDGNNGSRSGSSAAPFRKHSLSQPLLPLPLTSSLSLSLSLSLSPTHIFHYPLSSRCNPLNHLVPPPSTRLSFHPFVQNLFNKYVDSFLLSNTPTLSYNFFIYSLTSFSPFKLECMRRRRRKKWWRRKRSIKEYKERTDSKSHTEHNEAVRVGTLNYCDISLIETSSKYILKAYV